MKFERPSHDIPSILARVDSQVKGFTRSGKTELRVDVAAQTINWKVATPYGSVESSMTFEDVNRSPIHNPQTNGPLCPRLDDLNPQRQLVNAHPQPTLSESRYSSQVGRENLLAMPVFDSLFTPRERNLIVNGVPSDEW